MTTSTATDPVRSAPVVTTVTRGAIDLSTPASTSGSSIWTATRIIALVLTVLETLLLTRFALSLFGANKDQPLVSFINAITAPFVVPFQGIFGQPPGVDVTAILAVVFFLLVGALVLAGSRAITGRRTSPPPTS